MLDVQNRQENHAQGKMSGFEELNQVNEARQKQEFLQQKNENLL